MSDLQHEISKTCPKCSKERGIESVTLALPGYLDPRFRKDSGEKISVKQALPVRIVLCPHCNYIELYRDVE